MTTITDYNAMDDIDPAEWMTLGEDDRIRLVSEYHEAIGVDLPDVMMHAMLHVIIENQIALGDETPVADKLIQLRAEGLDRHESIHALASVLTSHLVERMQDSERAARSNDDYYSDLEVLTAESWLQGAGDESADDKGPAR